MGVNGKGMRQLNTWPRALLKLPLAMRVVIVGGTIFFALLFYVLSFSTVRNGYVLAIPVMLAAWVFKRKGLFTFMGAALSLLLVYQSIRHGGLLWPLPFALSVIVGLILLTIFGFVIIALRDLLDAEDREQNETDDH